MSPVPVPVGPGALVAMGLLLAGAVALVVPLPADPRGRTPRMEGRDGGAAPRRRTVLVGCALAGAGAVLVPTGLLPGRALALAVILGCAVAGALRLRARGRRRAARDARRAEVLMFCEALAGELAAGQSPGRAVERAVESQPALRPVAHAEAMGADVPAAIREAARAPGAEDLYLCAAAWQVSLRAGAGLSEAIAAVAESVRAAQTTRRVVASELSSARATARLMACLPVVAMLMGSSMGGNPWAFLLGTPIGLTVLAAGLAFGFAGLLWIEAIADSVDAAAGGQAT